MRIAILPNQTAGLPSAPTNPKDQRQFDSMLIRACSDQVPQDIAINPDVTWQAEALPPDQLARIVTGAIEARLDRNAYARTLADEQVTREAMLARLADNELTLMTIVGLTPMAAAMVGVLALRGPRSKD